MNSGEAPWGQDPRDPEWPARELARQFLRAFEESIGHYREVTHANRPRANDDAPGYVMICGAVVFVNNDGQTFPPTFDFYDYAHRYKATCEACRTQRET